MEETATGEDDKIGVVVVVTVEREGIPVIIEPSVVMVIRPEAELVEAGAVVADTVA
jgi:hypothetical protein